MSQDTYHKLRPSKIAKYANFIPNVNLFACLNKRCDWIGIGTHYCPYDIYLCTKCNKNTYIGDSHITNCEGETEYTVCSTCDYILQKFEIPFHCCTKNYNYIYRRHIIPREIFEKVVKAEKLGVYNGEIYIRCMLKPNVNQCSFDNLFKN